MVLLRREFSEGKKAIERWIANGFWYLEKVAAQWSEHPTRVKSGEEAYHRNAFVRLGELAWWLLFGESPYEGPMPPNVTQASNSSRPTQQGSGVQRAAQVTARPGRRRKITVHTLTSGR
jgi:hypothetical protein